jgi:hypothetical protein
MSGVISNLFGLCIPHGKTKICIAELESALACMTDTVYHSVIGKDFLHHADEIASVMRDFYQQSKGKGPIKAMYYEMNGFSINTDRWYCNGFGYVKGGTLWDLTWDQEWMCDWDYETKDITLTGMEEVQAAFASTFSKKEIALGVEIAGEIAEHLVTARFCELIKVAHDLGKQRCGDLIGLPIVSTAHEWDTVAPSE